MLLFKDTCRQEFTHRLKTTSMSPSTVVILAFLPTSLHWLQVAEYLETGVMVGKLKAVETLSFKHFNWLYRKKIEAESNVGQGPLQ